MRMCTYSDAVPAPLCTKLTSEKKLASIRPPQRKQKPGPARCFELIFLMAVAAQLAAAQSVTLSPTRQSFCTIALGGTSAVKNFTLKNGQTTAITIASVVVSGDYQIQTNGCQLAPSTL